MTGSSRATVSAGPMPGSTPMAVPMVTPSADQSRFQGVSATAKPWPSEASVSMVLGSYSASSSSDGSSCSIAVPIGRVRPSP